MIPKLEALILKNSKPITHFSNHIFLITSIIVSAFFYLLHLSSLEQCNSQAIGNAGDLTTGEIWWNWMVSSSDSPGLNIFSEKHKFANYPFGEEFFSITSINQLGRRLIIYFLTNYFGFICSQNIFLLIGIFLTAFISMIMLYLISNNLLYTMLLSLVITFSPYAWVHFYEHPTLTHTWIFSLLFYLVFKVNKSQKYVNYIFLLVGFTFFWDQYVFFGMLLILFPYFLFFYEFKNKVRKKIYFSFNLISIFIFLVTYSSDYFSKKVFIRSIAELNEYNLNPIYNLVIDTDSLINQVWRPNFYLFQSNKYVIGFESVQFSLFLLMALAILITFVICQLKAVNLRKFRSIYFDYQFKSFTFFIIFIFLIINIFLPSLIRLVSALDIDFRFPLRVFVRYLSLNLLVLSIFISLCVAKIKSKNIKVPNFLSLVVSLLLILQILVGIPSERRIVNYQDYPRLFDVIRNSEDIKSLMIYSSNKIMPFMQTYQPIFQKPLLNSTLNIDRLALNNAVGIADPYSINTVNKLGASHILIKEDSRSPGLSDYFSKMYPDTFVMSENFMSDFDLVAGRYSLYKTPSVKPSEFYIEIVSGFYPAEINLFSGRWTSGKKSILKVSRIDGKKNNLGVYVSLGIASNRGTNFLIKQDGNILLKGLGDKNIQEYNFTAMLNKDITIESYPTYRLNPPIDNRVSSIYVSSIYAVKKD